jgi:hypothetical protein
MSQLQGLQEERQSSDPERRPAEGEGQKKSQNLLERTLLERSQLEVETSVRLAHLELRRFK